MVSARRPAGYAALVEQFELETIPHWHRSFVSQSGVHRIETKNAVVEETYTSRHWPGETVGDHLEFALKHDGINLGTLAALFPKIDPKAMAARIESKPTGKYGRRLWFLYEFLTGEPLPLEDLSQGNYVDLLDPADYYASNLARPSRRQRINENLLGDSRFCPMIRRTDALREFEAAEWSERCRQAIAAYPPELLQRALSYLYMKETKSSFEIERIHPGPARIERFIGLLRLAEQEDFCEKERLIGLQNQIVDARFRESDVRVLQNYVGQTVAWRREIVHYVCPKPTDIAELMRGLIASHQRMSEDRTSPVVHAAAIAYGFVFLHPFEDGNGRIHRFLIHNILARRGFTPNGLIFPISAAMLNHANDYTASLEAFSRPLMEVVNYSLDAQGRMTVHGDTVNHYRYPDLTRQTEALFRFIELAIDVELAAELNFLAKYDEAKLAIRAIVDMPDRLIDLFIRFSLQNQQRLSARKRAAHFAFLSDEEVARMEQALQTIYRTDDAPQRP